MPTTDAPDLTLVAKTDNLANALVVILIEGKEAWKIALDGSEHYPTADGVTVTVPWAGDLGYAMGVARLAVETSIATMDEAQAMIDRAAAWDTNLPVEEVTAQRKAAEAEYAAQTARSDDLPPDVQSMLDEIFGGAR